MKFNVPLVLVGLPLKEYAQECGEETLRVWVNPNHGVVSERGAMLKLSAQIMAGDKRASDESIDELNQRWFAWLSIMLSQDTNPDTRRTAQEIAEAHEAAPDFVSWLTTRVTRLVDDYAAREKKRPMMR